ncbi:hypothetical protein BDV32DRAFT_122993 [Aspergillus pseudonomiae]|uniref:Uncharacterized protein n=1 Tax=Aspergillus pseudonomiae TaxID=1506151 RepID=A0A5N7DSV2_9EURO|nr:uncharacterized protein BDV37DRAFT_235953 [Aspergillus pseudonomiae]KAB8260479.1 hypothetical protein BDV32DRAFT_122993 [Aspergillus pseudonomiae]KAE8409456.1 hypothetical protein BDV37DRAFT_235953 [Aspergillus pseudonomiae]
MPQQTMTIPMRTSSVNALSNGMHMSNASHEDLRRESTSKAQKILGTTEIPMPQDQSRREDRKSRGASFMRAPDIKSKKSGGFAAFPTPTPEATLPPPHLRVRASSPLLGQEYRSQDAMPPSIPTHSKRVQQSGSSSTLFSYFNSRNSTLDSNPSHNTTKDSIATEEKGFRAQHNVEPRFGLKQPKGPMKDSKRKMRPPRIDLSLLFPKPRVDAAPMLSPQRLVNSPSAISMTSEHPAVKPQNFDNPEPTKRVTKTPPSGHKMKGHQATDVASESSPIYESGTTNWLDPSLERTVRTSEMEMALKRYSQFQKAPQPSEPTRSSQLHLRPRDREQPQASDTKSTGSSLRKVPSNSSAGGWSRELYLSPKSFSRPHNNRTSDSSNARHADSRENLSAYKSSMSKKSSKSTLKNVDLNKSSVLCLSSSEDEEDEEEAPAKHDKNIRDSVTTYADFEAEICTASAAQTTKGTLRRVERPYSMSASSRGSQSARQQQQTILRNPSMSSAGRSTLETRSHRSSGVPTISEPDFLNTDPMASQARKPSQRARLQQSQSNRRSRVIAVTRQEEHLLEAMRQRKGKITPSLFHEARYQDSHEPDRNSMLSVPSRDSFYGSDMSFLRLSPGLPPIMTRKGQGANHFDKDGSISQGATSDAEQKTINSNASPRVSLIYSESLPSPATSGASPLTPTLPIHRFSPLPSQKPPPRNPPPAIPPVQRRHSRRRTDSSEAIVLGDAEERKETDDFPIWALGWGGNDNANLTAVH